MRSRALLALPVAAAAFTLSLAGGCSSTAAEDQLADIRSNPTPELTTLAERPDDIKNQLTVTFDTNLRMFNRDLGTLMMLDRPSHLTPSPVR